MPKYIATLDFCGVKDLYGNYKRGNVYEFKETPTIEMLLKVGYLKKENVNIAIEEKELKQEYETKELKVTKAKK